MMALFAQQKVVAVAQATAVAQHESHDEQDHATHSSTVGADARTAIHTEQSMQALLAVHDEMENAYQRAYNKWRQRIIRGIEIARQGGYTSLFDDVQQWAEHSDQSIADKAHQVYFYLVAHHSDLSTWHSQLKDHSQATNIAWTLLMYG